MLDEVFVLVVPFVKILVLVELLEVLVLDVSVTFLCAENKQNRTVFSQL